MEKTGVILLNLGGPDSPEAVRPFLYNLFSDRDIIPLGPNFMQKPLAWLISTIRAPKTRRAYARIGGASPILEITQKQAAELEILLNSNPDHQSLKTNPLPPSFEVYIGMRYWHPFIQDTVEKAYSRGIRRLIGLSLYPHYSKATVGSTERIFRETAVKFNLETRFVGSWYNHPLYIDALAGNIMKGLEVYNSREVHLLFSAHSLPVSFIKTGDPYVKEIEETIRAVIERLERDMELPPSHLSYQSRSGPVEWLKPSTEEMIIELGRKGVRNLLVVPISFVSDHIETLYEIDILYRDLARRHGIRLERMESLNTNPVFISALRELVLTSS